MSRFENSGNVANQAAHQQNYGSVFNGPFNQLIIENLLALSPAQVRQQLEILDADILHSLSFREMFDRRANLEQPFSGTCKWVLDNVAYKKWCAQAHGLLWVKGKPGAGKSILMSWLYSELREQKPEQTKSGPICLDFFFSARGADLQHSAIGMLRSLLNQLFKQDESVRELIRRPYQEKCNAFGRSIQDWDWQRAELESLLQQAILKAGAESAVSIFIDALDEAGEQSARSIATYFHRINDLCVEKRVNVKICISCRHYPVVSSIPGHEVLVEGNNHHDISLYISHQLTSHLSHESSSGQDEWTQLQHTLIEQAKGVFQWVSLVVPMVQKAIDDGQSAAQVQEWLMEVPQELTSVYRHIMLNVISRRSIQHSLVLFIWILLAERQLILDEVRYILHAKHIVLEHLDDASRPAVVVNESAARLEQLIRALSGGLIEIVTPKSKLNSTEGKSYVQVIHQSVNDFLRSEGLSLLASLQPNTAVKLAASHAMQVNCPANICQGHIFIYWTCLKHLAMISSHSNTLSSFESSKRSQLLELHQTLQTAPPQSLLSDVFTDYATTFLFVHAHKSHRQNDIDHASEIQYLEQALPTLRTCTSLLPDINSTWRLVFANELQKLETIHIATLADLTGVVDLLIQQGEDVNRASPCGYTALHLAAAGGRRAMFRLLLTKGANFHCYTLPIHPITPLMMAADQGQAEIADDLLKHLKDSKSLKSNDQQTLLQELGREALVVAVQYGGVRMVKSLLQYGMGVDSLLPDGSTAMEVAIKTNNAIMVQFLIEAGADVDADDGDGPLLQRILCEHQMESRIHAVVQALLVGGANSDARGGDHGSALRAAIATGKIDLFRLLLASGVNVNFVPPGFDSPLGLAILKNQWYTVAALIEAGADVNLRAEGHEFPLQAAAAMGNTVIVEYLLKAGADETVTGGKYGTALEAALKYKRAEVALILRRRLPRKQAALSQHETQQKA